MSRFNLSEWAIRHRSLVAYFMLMVVVAGVASYLRLGRSEDPDFTIKTMVVQAKWPGATVGDTLQQVTDRLERKLQETPDLDYLKSYTSAGQATIFVYLQDSTPAARVPDIWYQVRKKVGDIRHTLPQGVLGPFFNDEFGDTYGIVYGFTADGFTRQELRDYVDEVRKRLLQLPDISKIDVLGAQDERVHVEFSTERMAGLGIDRAALVAALQAQNAVAPAGMVQTGDQEKILVRVSGEFESEQDVLAVNFVANGRMVRLGDIARVARGPADPPQPMFRVNGEDAIGLAIAMRTGGDVLALGRNVEHAMARNRRRPAGRDRGAPRRRPAGDRRARGGRVHGGAVGGRRHRPRRSAWSASACGRAPSWPSPSRWCWPSCSWRWRSSGSTCSASRSARSSSPSACWWTTP